MGLDTSHDCWHGAYSAFMRFRLDILKTLGFGDGSRETSIYVNWQAPEKQELWTRLEKEHPGIFVLINHSDCDGVIEVKDQLLLATELEAVAAKMPDEPGVGHLTHGSKAAALRFAKGLREANAAGEDVEFH